MISALSLDREPFFRLFHRALYVGCALCLLASFFFFFKSVEKDTVSLPTTEKKRALFAYETIGSGPLTLNPHLFYRCVPALLQELVLIHQEPLGKDPSTGGYLFGIRNTREVAQVGAGEVFYVDIDEKTPSLPLIRFAGKEAPFSLRPIIKDKEGVLVHASVVDPSGATQEMSLIIKEIPFSEFNESAIQEFMQLSPLKRLSSSKYWTKDVLYEQYGGQKFISHTRSGKLEIPSDHRSLFYLVSEGDLFFFDGENWKRSSSPLIDEKRIRAQVKTVGEEEMVLQVWDENGLVNTTIRIEPQPLSPFEIKEDVELRAAKLRGLNKVSCLLGKKRLLLKKGDWVLKTARSWRVLRTAQDIQDCLDHKIRGILLIVDDLEVKGDKVLLVGHIFNEMRTEMQDMIVNVEIPVAPKKNGSTSSKKSSKKGVISL